MKKIIFSLVLGLGMLTNANAAGDAQAGKSKAAACSSCHGANGIGTTGMFPNLAGQHADYLIKQLKAFKSGERANAMMAPMAAGLSEQDMADIAAYYASFSRTGEAPISEGGESADAAPASSAPVAYVGDAVKGKGLYEYGDESRGITACVACHGKDGASNVEINPNLAGQHPEYITKQLNAFKSGTRENASMNQVAGQLTSNDIADIAEFFEDTDAVANVEAKKPAAAKSFAGDVTKGKQLSATCSACHGADGNAVVAIYPKLAGQHEKYIVSQLQDFKKAVETQGKEGRADAVMGGMAAGLSADDMKNLAAYFASQTVSPGNDKGSDLGQKLYFSGDAARGITACVACHSADGKGMGSAGFPVVANQNVDYLKTQLAKFKSGERANDHNGMMRAVAAKLTDEDMTALAEYMSSL